MPNAPENSLTAAELIRLEIAGKKEALGRYDTILWQIRSGYVIIFYGALGLLFKDGLKLEALNQRMVLLFWGFSALAYTMDLSIRIRQLRVVAVYNVLVDQALKLSLGEGVDAESLRKLLHLAGESRTKLNRGVLFRAVCVILLFYATTPIFISFTKGQNVTKLIEDAEQSVSREEAQAKGRGPVRDKTKEMLDARLAGHHTAVIWPGKSQDIPDEDPRFSVAYLPLEFAGESKADQERQAKELLSKYGDRPRRFRNGLGLAIPDKKQIEALRRAIRYLLAIERVNAKKQQLRLTKDELDQLKERRRTEEVAAESCFRDLYAGVWLPRVQGGEIEIERVERGGRPLQAAGIHQRIMELLTSVGTPRVHGSVTPRKIAERVKLGEPVAPGESPMLGIKASELLESFFRDIAPPRLESSRALRKGIARGVTEGTFAYTSGSQPALGPDGKFQVVRDKVVTRRTLAEDEVDFESGFIMVPAAVPEAAAAPAAVPTIPGVPTPAPRDARPTGCSRRRSYPNLRYTCCWTSEHCPPQVQGHEGPDFGYWGVTERHPLRSLQDCSPFVWRRKDDG